MTIGPRLVMPPLAVTREGISDERQRAPVDGPATAPTSTQLVRPCVMREPIDDVARIPWSPFDRLDR
jgi:hypothetical protein